MFQGYNFTSLMTEYVYSLFRENNFPFQPDDCVSHWYWNQFVIYVAEVIDINKSWKRDSNLFYLKSVCYHYGGGNIHQHILFSDMIFITHTYRYTRMFMRFQYVNIETSVCFPFNFKCRVMDRIEKQCFQLLKGRFHNCQKFIASSQVVVEKKLNSRFNFWDLNNSPRWFVF